jgi:Flp pilus assembly protein TadG
MKTALPKDRSPTGRFLCRYGVMWVALSVLIVGVVQLGLAANRRPWFAQALTSRMAWISEGIFLVTLAILCGVCWLAIRRARQWRQRHAHAGGAVIVEFVLVLPIALMLVLVMVQTSLLMVGNICVHYAAFAAARAAIVQIPYDYTVEDGVQQYYSHEGPNEVFDWGQPNALKLEKIRAAAAWAMMPVSCSSMNGGTDDGLQADLKTFYDAYARVAPNWVDQKYLGSKWSYANAYTDAKLLVRSAPDNPDSDYREMNFWKVFQPAEEVRVQVEHEFYLSVPYANRFFFALLKGDSRELDFGEGQYALALRAEVSLTNEGVRDFIVEENFDLDNR